MKENKVLFWEAACSFTALVFCIVFIGGIIAIIFSHFDFDIVLPVVCSILTILSVFSCCYIIYENVYFKSEEFKDIKHSIEKNTNDCNELNSYISSLRNSYMVNFKHLDYGNATYDDKSLFKYKRSELRNINTNDNFCQCSLSVCKNAQQQPFKYVCKYFNIEATEENLSIFEKILNNFISVEDGKKSLLNERQEIIDSIGDKIPPMIKNFSERRLIMELGFDDFNFGDIKFPEYNFQYISAGGNSSISCKCVFDISNLNRFIVYLSEIIKFKKTAKYQRALMTSSLRERIKKRDNYTCKNCGLSTRDEPNLLLEIDHIIPLSKNGKTTEDNLQTLCWRCNRKKSNKIILNDKINI